MAPAIACKLNTDTTIHQELIKLTPESLMTLDTVDGTNFISNARYFRHQLTDESISNVVSVN